MAQATVKTIQYIDPRIEPQPDPVYDYVIAPTQNQYYELPASGLSNSSVTFNNLTTLGVDRAYLDTFELEIEAEIVFNLAGTDIPTEVFPTPDQWTFDSFPFNKCCEQARVNINGGAFFSEPLSYLRAKERYMDQWKLSRCYENVCPCHRPMLQYESGKRYTGTMNSKETANLYRPFSLSYDSTTVGGTEEVVSNLFFTQTPSIPTRYGVGMHGYMQSAQGIEGGFNNAILRSGAFNTRVEPRTMENYFRRVSPEGNVQQTVVKVIWREPIFCSPFSSRYDATYGRPLYNITSMDITFTLQSLGNMIRLSNMLSATNASCRVNSYYIDLKSVKLRYQVMTIPPVLNKPLTTLVPYRRFVPYITDYKRNPPSNEEPATGNAELKALDISSGVYTLNEIPTAIWVFVAPVKRRYQMNDEDRSKNNPNIAVGQVDNVDSLVCGNWDSNKLFAFIQHVRISMANTTQILDTATPYDLYRIAKANGCDDSFASWNGSDIISPKWAGVNIGGENLTHYMYGAGSVLRLKPGVDLIVPDQPLIPGANANNMVFQAHVQAIVPPGMSTRQQEYALWLLFEYVGVAAISPGQCEITMNPLGSGEIVQVSPVMSATSEATEGDVETAGGWEKVKKGAQIAAQIAEEGIISKILKHIPGAEGAAKWAEKHGLGEPGRKRGRGMSGGAVMGHGLNDWVA